MLVERGHFIRVLPLVLIVLLISQCAYHFKGLTTKKIVKKCDKGVVTIIFYGRTYQKEGEPIDTAMVGTGFIVSQDGYILTAEHIIGGGRVGIERSNKMLRVMAIRIIMNDGKEYRGYLPEPYPPNLGTEIGILKIAEVDNLPHIEIAQLESLELGEPVIVLGYPQPADALTVTKGIINSLGPMKDDIRISAAISGGVSGAPVLSSNGKAIGLARLTITESRLGKVCAFFQIATNLIIHREEILNYIEQDRKKSNKE